MTNKCSTFPRPITDIYREGMKCNYLYITRSGLSINVFILMSCGEHDSYLGPSGMI